ncbi:hypothetical protein AIIMSE5_040 [Acinetobacter phage AIIMS-AbE5-RC]|uniref:Uncharacterized protein n=1 Tax=Acinetobacter phage AIIMS-AbE5-RC TaxID=2981552 RepID=A0A9X9JRK5_9CAUD|nr:hypothetical protein AIIMSE5_040 [Acinetobacter phage AIIMS-AbE5-RC]
MRGHNYIVGDRVYRTVSSPIIPKGTKGTVGSCHMDELVQIQFDNGRIWYCDITFIKPLVRVVG